MIKILIPPMPSIIDNIFFFWISVAMLITIILLIIKILYIFWKAKKRYKGELEGSE